MYFILSTMFLELSGWEKRQVWVFVSERCSVSPCYGCNSVSMNECIQ